MTSSSSSRFFLVRKELKKKPQNWCQENKYNINCGSFDIESFLEKGAKEERMNEEREGERLHTLHSPLSLALACETRETEEKIKKQVDGWNVDSLT